MTLWESIILKRLKCSIDLQMSMKSQMTSCKIVNWSLIGLQTMQLLWIKWHADHAPIEQLLVDLN